MILASADIFDLSPDFHNAVTNLHITLYPVAFVVCVWGITSAAIQAMHEHALASIWPKLVTVLCIALFLLHMGEVGDWFGSIVDGIKQQTGISANPMQAFTNVIYQRFHVDLSQTFNKITPGGLVGPSYTPTHATTISHYGYSGDSTPDPNSSAGVGAYNNSLTALSAESLANGTVSLGISPSLSQGLNLGQKITVPLANGQTITGIYADKTAPSFNGQTLYRVDVYDPNNQINNLIGDGTVVNSINGSADSPGKTLTWQDVLAHPNESLQAMLFGLFTLILAYVAAGIMWLASLLQSIVYYCMIAVGPIFAGFLVVRGLENIAKTFILGFVAVSLFPIGFLLSGLVTQFLIGLALNPALNGTTEGSNIIGGGMLFLILVSIWVVFSSFFAPFLISKAFASGALGLGTLVLSSARGLQTASHTTTSLASSTSRIASSSMIRSNGSRPFQSYARRPLE